MRTNLLAAWSLGVASLALAGCGRSSVTVQVLGEGTEGPTPQARLPVAFYPFDRDSLFDLLDAQAATAKPEIPQDMLETFQQIRALQEEWRAKEAAWSDARELLKQLSDEMAGMDRRDPNYRRKYDAFNRVEQEERRLDREKRELFDQFTSLQEQVSARVDSFRIVRDNWEEEAYAAYFDMETELTETLGRQVFEDTTSAAGYVTRALPAGDWWISTRIRVPRGELVWNVRIDPSQADTVVLSSENGEERLRL